jgi:autotransporter translocation and assembly factor TamB
MFRRALVALAVGGLLAGVAVGAAWIAFRLYGPDLIRAELERGLASALGRAARVDAVSFRPWAAGLRVSGVTVASGPRPDDGTLLRLDHADVGVRLESLWRRRLVIAVILADLDLATTAGGGDAGLAALALPSTFTVGSVEVRVGRVGLMNGRVRHRDPEAGWAIEARGIDADGRPEPDRLAVSTRAESLLIETSGVRERLERPRADGIVRPGQIRLDAGRFDWEGHEIRLAGELRQPGAAVEVRATARGDVALAALAKRAGVATALGGLARVEATVDGPITAPRLEARVAVPDLAAGPLRVHDVRLAGTLIDGTLRVPDLQGDLFGGRVRGALTVQPEATGRARRVVLTLSDLRLPGALAPLGPGTVQADARVTGDTIELGAATGRWSGARLDVAGRVDPGQRLGIRADLEADLRVLGPAAIRESIGGQVRVTADGTGTWERPVLAGRLETGPLRLGSQPVDRAEFRYRLEGHDGRVRWTGTLEAVRITAPGLPLEDLSATFALDGTAVDVQRLAGRVASVPVVARGAWQWTGRGRADAELGPARLAALPGRPPGLSLAGTGSGRIQATMERGTVAATGSIALSDVALADVPLGTGGGQLTLNGREVTAELRFPARRVWATGSGQLETGRFIRAHARAERLELDPLLRRYAPAAQRHVSGTVSARVEAEVPVGQLEAARATVWVTPEELVVGGQRWTARFPAVIRWERRQLSLADLRLAGPLGTLTASGVVAAESGEGRLALAVDDARLPPPLDGVGRGRVQAEARLTPTALEDVSLRAGWPAGSLTLGGRAPFEGAMALRAQLTGAVAELAQAFGLGGLAGQAAVTAEVGGPWSAPVAKGRIEVPSFTAAGVTLSRVSVPFQLTATALRIDQASALLGSDPLVLDGQAASTEGGWRGRGTLAAPRIAVAGWPIDGLRAAFAVDADRLTLTEVALQAAGVPTRATGSWAWREGGRLEGQVGPARLHELPTVPPGLDLAGAVTGRFEGRLSSLDDVTATARLDLTEVQAAGVALGAGTLDVSARGRALHARLGFPERRLTATADGRTDSGAMVAVRAAVDELNLAELAERLGGKSSTALEGRVSARLLADVPLHQLAEARGTLRLEPLDIRVAGETLTSRAPIVARWDAGGVRVEPVVLEGPAGRLAGRGAWKPDGGLEAEVRGQVPLALVARLRPEVEQATGILDVAATVAGTTAAPVVEGQGAVRGGSLRLRGYPDGVRDIEARIVGSPAGLRLLEARGAFSGGTVTASGEAALARGGALGAYRVALGARRVALAHIENLSTLWDADLELAGRGARAQLAGELRLLRGAYTGELTPAARPAAPGGPADGGLALPLRVVVKLDDNLVVRNRTAHLRVGGRLSVEGSTAQPAVLGAVEVRDGTVVFRDRRFTVVSATARFLDPRRIDPFLDAAATARIREYDVTVRLSGRTDNVEVRLHSTPPLSEEDLLALVAFGVTRAELEQSATGVVAEEAARVIVRDLLGFEGFGPLASSDPSKPAGRLQVGTRVAERSTLPGQAPDSRGDQRVTVEYRLAGPLSVVGERGVHGGYSAGLVLRLRFR